VPRLAAPTHRVCELDAQGAARFGGPWRSCALRLWARVYVKSIRQDTCGVQGPGRGRTVHRGGTSGRSPRRPTGSGVGLVSTLLWCRGVAVRATWAVGAVATTPGGGRGNPPLRLGALAAIRRSGT